VNAFVGSAKRVQFFEGATAAADHLWNGIVAPVTDGGLKHVEGLCRCEHCRPLPADQVEDSPPQSPSDVGDPMPEPDPSKLKPRTAAPTTTARRKGVCCICHSSIRTGETIALT
jgi:hypothetical protein